MKVLYITDRDDKFGAPKSMIEMILNLRKKYNIEPIVITSVKNNINKICTENKIENYVTYHQKHLYVETGNKLKDAIKLIPRYIRYKIGNFRAKIEIKKKINMQDIDIIHTNTSSLDIGAILAEKYHKKHIVHIREFGDKDFNMKSYRKNYISFFNKNTTCFFAISDAIKEGWIKKGIQKEKIIRVYNGISIEDIEIKKYEKQNNDTKLKLIISGSICEGKGQKEIVQALAKIPKDILENVHLDIIGEGIPEYKKEIETLIKENNLEKYINLLPYKNDLRKCLKDYDIGIVCSRAEGFGRITVEYMATQLVVIASDTGANPEIIDDGINGFLYHYHDIEDLANKIVYIYEHKEMREQIGIKGREKVLENFISDINAKNVYQNYKKIIERCKEYKR